MMEDVSYCPVCGTKAEDQNIGPLQPYIDCEQCGEKVFMEVWTY